MGEDPRPLGHHLRAMRSYPPINSHILIGQGLRLSHQGVNDRAHLGASSNLRFSASQHALDGPGEIHCCGTRVLQELRRLLQIGQ